MYTTPELIVIGATALVAGIIIGAVLSRLFNSGNRKNRDLENQLRDSANARKEYEQEVSEHYVKTAKLVDELTESYRQVHNHLAEGAATLLHTHHSTPLMKTIPSREQIDAILEPVVEDKVLQPLDYAPKKSPNEKGMLDESFGLDKVPGDSPAADNPLQEFYQTEGEASATDSKP